MSYYSAHYKNPASPVGITSIEFGRDRGILYLYKTTSRKEAFAKAQEVANEVGQVVTVLIDTPVAGCGMRGTVEKVYPIRGKIKFVRMTKQYRENWYDVI